MQVLSRRAGGWTIPRRMAQGLEIEHSEVYVRGGIEYEITVIRIEDGHLGKWTCGQCRFSGLTSKSDRSVQEAVSSAIAALSGHHLRAHREYV